MTCEICKKSPCICEISEADYEYGEPEAAGTATPVETASRWELILERERTKVAECAKAIKDAVTHRDWLTEGRGPYEWNDDNWHAEFAAASKEILTALEPLEKIAGDLSDCPTKWKDVLAAREELESQLTQVREELKELRGWKESAMVQLAKSDRLKELLPAGYLGWDIYDATVAEITRLRSELEGRLRPIVEKLIALRQKFHKEGILSVAEGETFDTLLGRIQAALHSGTPKEPNGPKE